MSPVSCTVACAYQTQHSLVFQHQAETVLPVLPCQPQQWPAAVQLAAAALAAVLQPADVQQVAVHLQMRTLDSFTQQAASSATSHIQFEPAQHEPWRTARDLAQRKLALTCCI